MAQKYGNKETQHLFDRTHGGAEKEPAEEKAPAFGGEKEVEKPEDVVAQQGKAHTIHIKHDHKAGKHHVHALHESGHEHHSDHASVEEAHAHAAKLAGSEAHESLEDSAAKDLAKAGHPGDYDKASALGVGSMSE